jgi:hypothetical protein
MIHNSQLSHGVQIGAIYAAFEQLGWFKMIWCFNTTAC